MQPIQLGFKFQFRNENSVFSTMPLKINIKCGLHYHDYFIFILPVTGCMGGKFSS